MQEWITPTTISRNNQNSHNHKHNNRLLLDDNHHHEMISSGGAGGMNQNPNGRNNGRFHSNINNNRKHVRDDRMGNRGRPNFDSASGGGSHRCHSLSSSSFRRDMNPPSREQQHGHAPKPNRHRIRGGGGSNPQHHHPYAPTRNNSFNNNNNNMDDPYRPRGDRDSYYPSSSNNGGLRRRRSESRDRRSASRPRQQSEPRSPERYSLPSSSLQLPSQSQAPPIMRSFASFADSGPLHPSTSNTVDDNRPSPNNNNNNKRNNDSSFSLRTNHVVWGDPSLNGRFVSSQELDENRPRGPTNRNYSPTRTFHNRPDRSHWDKQPTSSSSSLSRPNTTVDTTLHHPSTTTMTSFRSSAFHSAAERHDEFAEVSATESSFCQTSPLPVLPLHHQQQQQHSTICVDESLRLDDEEEDEPNEIPLYPPPPPRARAVVVSTHSVSSSAASVASLNSTCATSSLPSLPPQQQPQQQQRGGETLGSSYYNEDNNMCRNVETAPTTHTIPSQRRRQEGIPLNHKGPTLADRETLDITIASTDRAEETIATSITAAAPPVEVSPLCPPPATPLLEGNVSPVLDPTTEEATLSYEQQKEEEERMPKTRTDEREQQNINNSSVRELKEEQTTEPSSTGEWTGCKYPRGDGASQPSTIVEEEKSVAVAESKQRGVHQRTNKSIQEGEMRNDTIPSAEKTTGTESLQTMQEPSHSATATSTLTAKSDPEEPRDMAFCDGNEKEAIPVGNHVVKNCTTETTTTTLPREPEEIQPISRSVVSLENPPPTQPGPSRKIKISSPTKKRPKHGRVMVVVDAKESVDSSQNIEGVENSSLTVQDETCGSVARSETVEKEQTDKRNDDQENFAHLGKSHSVLAHLPEGHKDLVQVGTRVAVYLQSYGFYHEGIVKKIRADKKKGYLVRFYHGGGGVYHKEWQSFRKYPFFILSGGKTTAATIPPKKGESAQRKRNANNNMLSKGTTPVGTENLCQPEQECHSEPLERKEGKPSKGRFNHYDWVDDDEWVLGAVKKLQPATSKKRRRMDDTSSCSGNEEGSSKFRKAESTSTAAPNLEGEPTTTAGDDAMDHCVAVVEPNQQLHEQTRSKEITLIPQQLDEKQLKYDVDAGPPNQPVCSMKQSGETFKAQGGSGGNQQMADGKEGKSTVSELAVHNDRPKGNVRNIDVEAKEATIAKERHDEASSQEKQVVNNKLSRDEERTLHTEAPEQLGNTRPTDIDVRSDEGTTRKGTKKKEESKSLRFNMGNETNVEDFPFEWFQLEGVHIPISEKVKFGRRRNRLLDASPPSTTTTTSKEPPPRTKSELKKRSNFVRRGKKEKCSEKDDAAAASSNDAADIILTSGPEMGEKEKNSDQEASLSDATKSSLNREKSFAKKQKHAVKKDSSSDATKNSPNREKALVKKEKHSVKEASSSDATKNSPNREKALAKKEKHSFQEALSNDATKNSPNREKALAKKEKHSFQEALSRGTTKKSPNREKALAKKEKHSVKEASSSDATKNPPNREKALVKEETHSFQEASSSDATKKTSNREKALEAMEKTSDKDVVYSDANSPNRGIKLSKLSKAKKRLAEISTSDESPVRRKKARIVLDKLNAKHISVERSSMIQKKLKKLSKFKIESPTRNNSARSDTEAAGMKMLLENGQGQISSECSSKSTSSKTAESKEKTVSNEFSTAEDDEARRRKAEARTLTPAEVRAILGEDSPCSGTTNWVRRSARMPSRAALMAPNTQVLLHKLCTNDDDMVVLKMKKYVSDPATPSVVIDAVLDALEENRNCESLYIQNYNEGMRDAQVLRLLEILKKPSCKIWCLNIGETYRVKRKTWKKFARGLRHTKITHMYASEHTITSEMKEYMRAVIRDNRSKHSMHIDPENLETIVRCTHCWWNPINAKVLRPYLHAKGYAHILDDKEAQGARGTKSAAQHLI